MSLIDYMKSKCILMEKKRTPDGAGGFTVKWDDGVTIDAAIVFDTSMQARMAEQQGVTSLYTITVSRNIPLEYHDVLKRVSDGKIFRITSDNDDKISPAVSTLDIRQCTAEEWQLT